MAAFALCWQVVLRLVLSDSEWGDNVGLALVLTGIILMVVSQSAGRNRQGSGTP
ncbi:hypothetical protein ACIQFZ_40090 [Streptomyces sp. NPDC093064]|uniref:hypothetical protein n=1 Tax=Streptomyces sp. NPDC093064 TaxID=3366020 RepID=UPI0038256C94